MILRLGFLTSAAALALACAPPTAGLDGGVVTSDANAGPDAARLDSGPTLSVVSVIVRDDAGPLLGATVVVDDVNGDRHSATTGAGGRAMVGGVAWGTGRITITAVADDHPMQSLAGFRRSELGTLIDTTGTITMRMTSYYQATGVSGHVLHAPDPSRAVYLYPDISGTMTVTGTSFTGSLERAVPFHIYAVDAVYDEISSFHYAYGSIVFARVDHVALTGASTFDVDMMPALPLTTVASTLDIPPDGHRVQGGLARAQVTSDETRGDALLGFASEVAVATDGLTFALTFTQLATIDAATPLTRYSMETSDLYATVYTVGLPTAHAAAAPADWADPPELTTPGNHVAASLHDPITLARASTIDVRFSVDDTYGAVWYLDVPRGATSVTIPDPPAGTDTTWTDLTVRVDACDPWTGYRTRCRRSAGGESFPVTP